MNKQDPYDTDDDLVAAIRSEEASAFTALYHRYFAMVQHLIMTNSGQLEDAKDIFQESIIQLFMNIRTQDFKLTAKLGTYLYSIARNKWRERMRSTAKTDLVDVVDTEEGIAPMQDTIAKEQDEQKIALMQKTMGQLTEECQRILRLFYFSRLSMDQIAQRMDYTYEFAKQKKSRCLKKLREMTRSQWPES